MKKNSDIFITLFKHKGVERLSENEQVILSLMQNEPSISKAQMVEKGELSKKTVEYNIESLKKKGVLRRVGGAKGGYWEVIT